MSTISFEKRTAIFLAAICGQTYTQFENESGTFVVPRTYEIASTFKAASFAGKEEYFGYMLESKDTIVIAFRGSNTRSDWISDVIARQNKFPYMRDSGLVHRGFLSIYKSARKKIISTLSKLSPQKKLFVTGHSLGGALATLCAVDIVANTPFESPCVYTFASPRVGNAVFAKTFDRQIATRHRIYNVNDLVPQLPPVIYRSPKTDQNYYYVHVKKGDEVRFQKGSISANHAIGNYFSELVKLDTAYAQELCTYNPGFCPNG
ncbi:lipase family protein [Paenibacillus sp. SYP-B3998]|uniref:Lipase family protein n=1 Tax=Paenibacillus sp. SYP-B3998 TaxID=2678564 RepID=A0A6G4A0W3_9BACL|nr:lipase family protein [Paenibacillus sp. SYP-B3998]NEW07574.1 lipase family protein [Paenibacillus sp. SYP-B3998]